MESHNPAMFPPTRWHPPFFEHPLVNSSIHPTENVLHISTTAEASADGHSEGGALVGPILPGQVDEVTAKKNSELIGYIANTGKLPSEYSTFTRTYGVRDETTYLGPFRGW
jgi:hypothetical protein